MINKLIKLADKLDQEGNTHLASRIDQVVVALAKGLHGEVGIFEFLKAIPGAKEALERAISFELAVEPNPNGGSLVKAIPKVDDKWTDGLNLGDLSDYPKIQKFLTDEGKNTLYSDLPELGESEFEYIPTRKDKGDLDNALEQAYKIWEREEPIQPRERSEEGQNLYNLHQQRVKNLEKARRQRELNRGLSGAMEYVEQNQFIQPEEVARMQRTEAEVMLSLVKMADRFDQMGRFDLAAEIDQTLRSYSARTKAPLKKLDDDVKKNLILFIHDADQNTSKSTKGLNELFRRLRYFDLSDSVRDLGLDKVVREMEKTQECLDGAKKRFYELMHGKKPSKQDLEELFKTLDESDKEQNALDFFDQHSEDDIDPTPEKDLVKMDEEYELLGSFMAGSDGVKDLGEEDGYEDLEKFFEEEDIGEEL